MYAMKTRRCRGPTRRRSRPDRRSSVDTSIPRTPTEYRAWWEASTDVPYGYCWCGCGQQSGIVKGQTNLGGQRFRGEPVRYVRGHNGRKSRPTDMPVLNPSGLCMCGCRQPVGVETGIRRGRWRGDPVLYLPGHNRCKKPFSVEAYREEDRGYPTLCWIWLRTPGPYPQIWHNGEMIGVHRYVYEQEHGVIPAGQHIHHLCEQTECMRLSHLRAMTPSAHKRLHLAKSKHE